MFCKYYRIYRSISQEEYDALSDADQERYSKTDTVGKAGLEKAMDSQLQGKKEARNSMLTT